MPSDADRERQRDLNLQSFDLVWTIVNEEAWEEEFDAAGWQAQRDRYRPRITLDSTREDLRKDLGEMLKWLNRSHFGILPEQLYEEWENAASDEEETSDSDQEDTETEEKAEATENDVEPESSSQQESEEEESAGTEDKKSKPKDGHIGFQIRLVERYPTVTRVFDGSDARAQGVLPGWRLVEVGGKSVADMVETIRESLIDSDESQLASYVGFVADQRLRGPSSAKLELLFHDADDQPRALKLKYTKLEGEQVTIAHLPPMTVQHAAREVVPGVGYFWFDGFFAPVQVNRDLRQALRIAQRGCGLVIDLRGNGGGLAAMAMGIGNPLVAEKASYLGTLRTKDTTLRFTLFPRARPYVGPVAVLIDECSASTAEFLAGGLQSLGRAKIFGTRSAGAALPSVITPLPNGDRFQHAFASYVDANNRSIEGRGVLPDVDLPLRREDLLAGQDAVLAAAIDWILHAADKAAETPAQKDEAGGPGVRRQTSERSP